MAEVAVVCSVAGCLIMKDRVSYTYMKDRVS